MRTALGWCGWLGGACYCTAPTTVRQAEGAVKRWCVTAPPRSETVAPRKVARGYLDTDNRIWILRMNHEAQAQLEKLKSADGAASSMNAAGVTCLDIMNIHPLTIQ